MNGLSLLQTTDIICKNEFCNNIPTDFNYCKDCYLQKRIICYTMKICIFCDKSLQPIGHSRKNGKNHTDWCNRIAHKKCYL